MTLKKSKVGHKRKTGADWQIKVEAVGTPVQREQAVRQAVNFILTRPAGKKNNTSPEL